MNATPTNSAPIGDWLTTGGCMVPLDPKSEHCQEHGPYISRGHKLRLREVWTQCPACEAIREATEKAQKAAREAAERAEAFERRLQRSAIPPRFLTKSMDNYRADTVAQRAAFARVRAYLDNFPANYRKGRGLVLAGKPGTGKSHLATAVLRAVLGDFFGAYVSCPDYIRAIRATWHKESSLTEAQVLDEYARVSLLVLDEIGVAFGTDGEQKHIFDLLDRRYRELKPTILLTNQDAAGVKQFIGERSFDRLTETCEWVPFDWPSYRKTAAKEGV